MKFQSFVVPISPKDHRHSGMVNLMFAYFYVILIKGRNIDGDGMQLTARSAEGDNSLIHFIVLAFINFGIGEHLECRFSSPEFVQFVCCLIVVTFEPPCVLDHSSI